MSDRNQKINEREYRCVSYQCGSEEKAKAPDVPTPRLTQQKLTAKMLPDFSEAEREMTGWD